MAQHWLCSLCLAVRWGCRTLPWSSLTSHQCLFATSEVGQRVKLGWQLTVGEKTDKRTKILAKITVFESWSNSTTFQGQKQQIMGYLLVATRQLDTLSADPSARNKFHQEAFSNSMVQACPLQLTWCNFFTTELSSTFPVWKWILQSISLPESLPS